MKPLRLIERPALVESSAIKVIVKQLAQLAMKIFSAYVLYTVLMDALKISWLMVPVNRYAIPQVARMIMGYVALI